MSGREAMLGSLRRTAITSIPWDLTWLFGGLFLGIVGLASQRFVPALRFDHDDSLLIGLAAVAVLLGTVNRWGSTMTVLAFPLFRERRHPSSLRFYWGPRAVVVGSFALGILAGFSTEPDLTQGSRIFLTGAFSLALNLYFWWEVWHFTAQDFGVLSLYRMRNGQRGVWDRRIDRSFAVFAILVCLPLFRLEGLDYAGTSHRTFFLPGIGIEQMQPVLAALAPVAAALLGALALFVVGREVLRPDRCIWKTGVYLKMLAAPVFMFVAGSPSDLAILGFYLVYTVDHWMVAVGLVGKINLSHERVLSRESADGAERPRRGPLATTALRLAPIVLLAWYLQLGFADFNLFDTESPHRTALSLNVSAGALVRGLLLGWFLAVNLLHFYCDRLLFSFTDAETRAAVAPLLFPKADPARG